MKVGLLLGEESAELKMSNLFHPNLPIILSKFFSMGSKCRKEESSSLSANSFGNIREIGINHKQ